MEVSFAVKAVDGNGFAVKSFAIGDCLITVSAAFWAAYTVFARRPVQKIGGFIYTAWTVLFAGGWILLFQFVFGRSLRPPQEWPDILCILYLGIIPTAVAFFAWNNAQRYISAGLLAVSGYFTPMLSALFGMLFFHETITFWQFTGMMIVFGSALIEPEIAQALVLMLKRQAGAVK